MLHKLAKKIILTFTIYSCLCHFFVICCECGKTYHRLTLHHGQPTNLYSNNEIQCTIWVLTDISLSWTHCLQEYVLWSPLINPTWTHIVSPFLELLGFFLYAIKYWQCYQYHWQDYYDVNNTQRNKNWDN